MKKRQKIPRTIEDIKTYRKRYRIINNERILEQEKVLRNKNRDKVRLSISKYNHTYKGRYAKMLGRSKSMGFDSIMSLLAYSKLITKPCFYCEKEIAPTVGIALDRKDNNKGYTEDNVVTCCKECNWLRMDNLTIEETKVAALAIKYYREHLTKTY